MKIILLKDLENLGKKYEIKDVSPGYAKNFLLPKKLAILATQENMKKIKEIKDAQEKEKERELEKIANLVRKLDGVEIEIPVKVGERGQFFEKITCQKIAKALSAFGFLIKKNQIKLEKPIEQIGEFPVKVVFPHNFEAEIKIIVIEKGQKETEEI